MKKIISLLAISLLSLSVQAGRPLSVDDANVNDAGVAHIETFWSRAADGSRSFTIAPTYSPLPGLDLIAQDVRTFSGGAHSQTLQAKMQVTSPKDNSCHFAWVVGATKWKRAMAKNLLYPPTQAVTWELAHCTPAWSAAAMQKVVTHLALAWRGSSLSAHGQGTLNQLLSALPNPWWVSVHAPMSCLVFRWMALWVVWAARPCSALAPKSLFKRIGAWSGCTAIAPRPQPL